MGRGKNVERNSWVRLPLDTFHFPFEYLDKNETQYLQKMYKINKMKRIENNNNNNNSNNNNNNNNNKNGSNRLCPIKSYIFDTSNYLPLDGFFRPVR